VTWPPPDVSDLYDEQCAHAPHCRSHFEDVQDAYDERHGIKWRCFICGATETHTHLCIGMDDEEEDIVFGPVE